MLGAAARGDADSESGVYEKRPAKADRHTSRTQQSMRETSSRELVCSKYARPGQKKQIRLSELEALTNIPPSLNLPNFERPVQDVAIRFACRKVEGQIRLGKKSFGWYQLDKHRQSL